MYVKEYIYVMEYHRFLLRTFPQLPCNYECDHFLRTTTLLNSNKMHIPALASALVQWLRNHGRMNSASLVSIVYRCPPFTFVKL
jgi:hypothetical protein